MTIQKIILSSKWHYGISKPELRAQKHISKIVGTVFIVDYFFWRPFWKYANYSTDFTKWDRFFISGWPALTLASPSLARAQARRDRRRIGCAQRMKWARAPTRFGPGKYTRPNPTWACTQYTVWRLTWML